MFYVAPGEGTSCTVYLSSDEDGEDGNKHDEKRERRDYTLGTDFSGFANPGYSVHLQRVPFGEEDPLTDRVYTWSLYPGYDGWYHSVNLYDNPYISDPSLDAGTYYVAIFVTDYSDSGEITGTARIDVGTVTIPESKAFEFNFNPLTSQFACETYIPQIYILL